MVRLIATSCKLRVDLSLDAILATIFANQRIRNNNMIFVDKSSDLNANHAMMRSGRIEMFAWKQGFVESDVHIKSWNEGK